MQVFKFHRGDTGLFNQQQLDLVYDQDKYLPFISHSFSVEAIAQQIDQKEKEFSQEQRDLLSGVLLEQYKGVVNSGLVTENIKLLKESNTYTVTTGHQLSLFTGPLFFVVKILHAIKLCKLLKERYPENNFIPVYWMASEDHDFDEIDHLNIFNRTIRWKHEKGGPVGRFDLKGMDSVREELSELFSSNPESELQELINDYDGKDLASATRNLVHKLFADHGLVIIDADNTDLKRSFSDVLQKELKEQFSWNAVNRANAELERNGVKLQISPREINLFYIEDGIRERIIKENSSFEIQGKGSYSLAELLELLDEYPERFSPNVVLRPVYQEKILPNLAYVGGLGEISYWLQLKSVFDACNISYPMIQVRNSILWIDKAVNTKKEKFDIQLEDIFKPVDLIKREYVEANETEVLDFDELDAAKEDLTRIMEEMIMSTDQGMKRYSEAEITRLNKQLDGMKSKLIKAAKSRHDDAMKAIEFISDRLFPGGNLQERSVNFFQFCPQGNVSERLQVLYSAIDPEEKDLIVIREV